MKVYHEIVDDLPQGGVHIIERQYSPGKDEPDVLEKFVFAELREDSWQPSNASDLHRLSHETGLLLGRLGMPHEVELAWEPKPTNYNRLDRRADSLIPPPRSVPALTVNFNNSEQTYAVEAALPLSKKVLGQNTLRGLGMSVVHYEVKLPPAGFNLWPLRVHHTERHIWVGEASRQTTHTYPRKMTPVGAVSGLHEALRDLRRGLPFVGGEGKIKSRWLSNPPPVSLEGAGADEGRS